MKKYFAIFAVLMFCFTPVAYATDNLFEAYQLDDDWANPGGVNWNDQPFVAASSHSLTSIKLKLFKNGVGGVMTVDIDADDGAGKPNTASVIATRTFDCTGLSTTNTGTIQEVTGYNVSLTAGVTYHIVMHNSAAATCSVRGKDNSGVTTLNWWSTDTGTTWIRAATPDQFYYEIYGLAALRYKTQVNGSLFIMGNMSI